MLVKHASNVPQCAEAFERVLLEAGAPMGAYTNLFATKEQISKLIADPRIKAVALTGSEAAGANVAAQAGKNLKKTTMELGGSDAFIASRVIDGQTFGVEDLRARRRCWLVFERRAASLPHKQRYCREPSS